MELVTVGRLRWRRSRPRLPSPKWKLLQKEHNAKFWKDTKSLTSATSLKDAVVLGFGLFHSFSGGGWDAFKCILCTAYFSDITHAFYAITSRRCSHAFWILRRVAGATFAGRFWLSESLVSHTWLDMPVSLANQPLNNSVRAWNHLLLVCIVWRSFHCGIFFVFSASATSCSSSGES